MSSSSNSDSREAEHLLAELEAVVAEAEHVLKHAASGSEDLLGTLRDRYALAADRMASLYANTREKVTTGARQADAAIRDNPYTSMGIALAAGVAAGLLIARGNHQEND
jgi:ElaB/YqjD/DUF883 family membrane-anchored ribosome-binding protein